MTFSIDYSTNATSHASVGLWTFFYGLVGERDSVVRIPGVRRTAEIFNILPTTCPNGRVRLACAAPSVHRAGRLPA